MQKRCRRLPRGGETRVALTFNRRPASSATTATERPDDQLRADLCRSSVAVRPAASGQQFLVRRAGNPRRGHTPSWPSDSSGPATAAENRSQCHAIICEPSRSGVHTAIQTVRSFRISAERLRPRSILLPVTHYLTHSSSLASFPKLRGAISSILPPIQTEAEHSRRLMSRSSRRSSSNKTTSGERSSLNARVSKPPGAMTTCRMCIAATVSSK